MSQENHVMEIHSVLNISDCLGPWHQGSARAQMMSVTAWIQGGVLFIKNPNSLSSHNMCACHWTDVYNLCYKFYS